MSTGDDNACCVEDLIQSDRHITLTQIAEDLNISIVGAPNIVHDQLGYRKTCAHWVPRQPTDELKAKQKEFSLEHLMHYHRESVTFSHCIVTGNMDIVATPKLKRASISRKHPL